MGDSQRRNRLWPNDVADHNIILRNTAAISSK